MLHLGAVPGAAAASPGSVPGRLQTAFFRVGDALKRTVLPAFTLIGSPVRGLRPLRALVLRTMKVPKLGSVKLAVLLEFLDDGGHQVAGRAIRRRAGQAGRSPG